MFNEDVFIILLSVKVLHIVFSTLSFFISVEQSLKIVPSSFETTVSCQNKNEFRDLQHVGPRRPPPGQVGPVIDPNLLLLQDSEEEFVTKRNRWCRGSRFRRPN